MLHLTVPWWELILRSVVVYAFLLIILRVSGKRQVGQLAPFDLVLLLVLSNAVQNSMNGADSSLVGGLVSALTLVALNFVMGVATFKSHKLEAFVEGRPTLLEKAQVTKHELEGALRLGGCVSVDEVHCAVLENNGAISVIPYRNRPT